ncbi:MAG TPA: hypothetical protein DDZ91_12035 [Firmicutes bacterium]|jgi:t-SNARE complex subunit (syntaxin)|nr:hypothetical protein [Bacillota bacterium]
MVILLPENLRQKLGEQASKEFVDLLNSTIKDAKGNILETAADRFEKRLSDIKADIIKWMFVFWVSQIAVITGVISYMQK